MLIVMHRLSELSRYNPGILSNYLASDQSWLLSEFISLAPFQFINGISAEITSQQLGIPRSPKLSFNYTLNTMSAFMISMGIFLCRLKDRYITCLGLKLKNVYNFNLRF